MSNFGFQVCRQVNDRDSLKGASVWSSVKDNSGSNTMDYFFTQIPQPIHKNSEMNEILSVGLTSIHNFPATEMKPWNSPIMDTLLTHLYDGTWLLETFSDWSYLSRRWKTFLHSWAHLFGLHRFASTIAIRVILSTMAAYWGDNNNNCQIFGLLYRAASVRGRMLLVVIITELWSEAAFTSPVLRCGPLCAEKNTTVALLTGTDKLVGVGVRSSIVEVYVTIGWMAMSRQGTTDDSSLSTNGQEILLQFDSKIVFRQQEDSW